MDLQLSLGVWPFASVSVPLPGVERHSPPPCCFSSPPWLPHPSLFPLLSMSGFYIYIYTFFSPLGETGSLEKAGVVQSSLCISWHRVSELFSGKVCPLELSGEALGGFPLATLLLPTRVTPGALSDPSPGEPAQGPGGKVCPSMRTSPCPMPGVGTQELLNLLLVPTQPPSAIHQNYCLSVPTDFRPCHKLANRGCWIFAYIWLPRFLGSSSPCNLRSLMDSRKVIFQLV